LLEPSFCSASVEAASAVVAVAREVKQLLSNQMLSYCCFPYKKLLTKIFVKMK
jgi:hypothetical protein